MSKANSLIVAVVIFFLLSGSILRGTPLIEEVNSPVADSNSISENGIVLIEPIPVSLEETKELSFQENTDIKYSENISAGEAGPEILAIGLAISVAILVWLIVEGEKAHNPD